MTWDDRAYGGGGPAFTGPPSPPSPAPPRRSSRRAVVLIAAIVVVLGGGAVAAVALTAGHGDSPPAARSPRAAASSPAVPAGWQTVVASQHGVSYAVPPGKRWLVKAPGAAAGFRAPDGTQGVTGSGVAVYEQGYCKGRYGSWHAQTVVADDSRSDLRAVAQDAAHAWARDGYVGIADRRPATLTPARVQPVALGGTTGQEATVGLVLHSDDRCQPPRAVVHAVAVPAGGGETAVLVVLADQGIPEAVNEADLRRIVASLRPL